MTERDQEFEEHLGKEFGYAREAFLDIVTELVESDPGAKPE